MLPLLAAIETVVQADQALAHAAAEGGQWAAIGAAAAPDAFLYVPMRTAAGPVLAHLPDPPAGERLAWRVTHTITSCDGTLAYSAGRWTRPDGHAGWYGMLWRNMPDRWRWITEQGHEGGPPADNTRIEDQSACPGPPGARKPPVDEPGAAVATTALETDALAMPIELSDGPLPPSLTLGEADAQGGSADRSLIWRINPVLGGKPGAHLLRLWSWDGERYRMAVLDYSAGE